MSLIIKKDEELADDKIKVLVTMNDRDMQYLVRALHPSLRHMPPALYNALSKAQEDIIAEVHAIDVAALVKGV